jgi:hypothetical protein
VQGQSQVDREVPYCYCRYCCAVNQKQDGLHGASKFDGNAYDLLTIPGMNLGCRGLIVKASGWQSFARQFEPYLPPRLWRRSAATEEATSLTCQPSPCGVPPARLEQDHVFERSGGLHPHGMVLYGNRHMLWCATLMSGHIKSVSRTSFYSAWANSFGLRTPQQ